MRIAGKVIGASAALFIGSVIFLAPDIVTGGDETARTIPVDILRAEPAAPAPARIRAINDADDAWFEAALDIERNGPTLSNLARLKAADDANFDAVLAPDQNDRTVIRLAQMRAREKLDDATQAGISQFDDVVTGSLPRDAAAAEAANPMTTRVPGIRDNSGFPAIEDEKPADTGATAAGDTVETVGSIPPRDEKAEDAGDVTASVGQAAAMPAPQKAKATEAAKPPASAKQARAYRPARRAQARPRFQDRGPLAKVFRIFVLGVGFLPSQL